MIFYDTPCNYPAAPTRPNTLYIHRWRETIVCVQCIDMGFIFIVFIIPMFIIFKQIWCSIEDDSLLHSCHSISNDKCRWSIYHGNNCGHFATCLMSFIPAALKGGICLLQMSIRCNIFIRTETGIDRRMSTDIDIVFISTISIYLYVAVAPSSLIGTLPLCRSCL